MAKGKIDKADYEKIEMLYNKHKNTMYKEAYSVLKDPFDAEDAVQQAVLRLISCASSIKSDQAGMTCNFLKMITRNIAIDIYNKKTYLNTKEDMVDKIDTIHMHSLTEVAQYIEDKEAEERITKIIEGLPSIYRDILLLEKVFGYSRKETMILLDQSYESLKKRMTRAKNKLLEELKKEGLNGGRENIGKKS